jgi:hypothetical protein
MLAKAAIPGSVLWPLLLGSGLTLVAQWFTLSYQTTRQRQASRADRQEARLLALQKLLEEVEGLFVMKRGVRSRSLAVH